MRRLSFAGLILLVFLCGGALGALALFFVADPSNPPSLPSAEAASQVPTVTQRYSDTQTVDLVVRRFADAAIRAPRGGVLTGTDCEADGTFVSGSTSFAVDGAPLLNLHTETPLFRDVEIGDRGPDIAALAAELARLGYAVSAGDIFTAKDLVAVRAMLSDIGGDSKATGLVLADVVWLPDSIVTASACAELGQPMSAGETLAKAGRPPVAAIEMPPDLLAGPRELRLDGIAIPVTEQLRIESSADIAALTRTPTYARAAADTGAGTGMTMVIPASLALVTPISAVPLPPIAVAMVSADTITGDKACVTDGQAVFEVRIVGRLPAARWSCSPINSRRRQSR